MRRRTLALLALVCAGLAYVGPTAAYEHASFTRDTSATIVANANAYNAIAVTECTNLQLGGTCNAITIINKGTSPILYTVSEDPDNTLIQRYRIDGSAWVTTGRVTAPAEVAVGATSTVTLDLNACGLCGGSRTVYYTVEGEKAGSLNSMQTKIQVTLS